MMNSANTLFPAGSKVLAMAVAMVLCSITSTAQAQNLVPNPGFEETDSCTFGLGLGALHHWYSAYLTPDHLQSCQPYGAANGLPLNIFTFQQPIEGSSCAGIFTYDGHTGIEGREWLMVPLLGTLVPGQTYYCSLRANAAFAGNGQNPQNWLASSKLGMLFTTYDQRWLWGDPYPAALNQAHILYPQILSDTVGWTLVSGSFVADSAYAYLMIGNFFSNALTDTLHLAPNLPEWGRFSYTLVDAVCVSPDPEGCDLGQAVQGGGEVKPVIHPNPATDRLVLVGRSHAEVRVVDLMGRSVWQGRVANDRWVLEVGGWARGGYVLQMIHEGRQEVHRFVLTE